MDITITQTPREENWYCKGTCGLQEADSGRPVYKITVGYSQYLRCSDCLVSNLNGGSGTVECSNCGTSLAGEPAFCDASCALAEGYDGGHDCEQTVLENEDFHTSCHRCGDDACYCSAECALAEDEGLRCDECGNEVRDPSRCSDCKTTTGSPTLVAAASNTIQPESAVADDGTVTIGGVEFRF